MGLDMYLNGHLYLSEWDATRKPYYDKVNEICGPLTGAMKVKILVTEAAYWRKANQIHQWFVDNVQGGQDNCREYYVDIDQLKELVDLCQKVLENKDQASELLPTVSGFFFGSTEYDEFYFEDIQNTIKMLTPYIEDEQYKKWSFYYTSSW